MLREDINILSEALNGATDLISMISTKIDPTTRLDFLNALAMDGRLNAGAVRIGIILLSHRNGKTGLICPSHRTVAREAGCAVSTVQRSIRTLVTAGWFRVIHQAKDGKKTVNRYVPDWDQIDRSPMTTLDKSSMIDIPVIHDLPDQSPMTGETGHQRPIEPSEYNPVSNNSYGVASSGAAVCKEPLPEENVLEVEASADASADPWDIPDEVIDQMAAEEAASASLRQDHLPAGDFEAEGPRYAPPAAPFVWKRLPPKPKLQWCTDCFASRELIECSTDWTCEECLAKPKLINEGTGGGLDGNVPDPEVDRKPDWDDQIAEDEPAAVDGDSADF